MTPSFLLRCLLLVSTYFFWMASVIGAQELIIPGLMNPQDPPEGLEQAKSIQIRMGAQVRLIPTLEVDWDFGIMDRVSKSVLSGAAEPTESSSTLEKLLSTQPNLDPRIHLTDAGFASQEYWRTEARLSLGFTPDSKKWELSMTLECDTILDSQSSDTRCANFGIERLHAQFPLDAWNSKIHIGWDFYTIDAVVIRKPGLSISGPLSVYADDDPGIWLDGEAEGWHWQVGWHKKVEANRELLQATQNSNAFPVEPQAKDRDRNVYDASLQYELTPSQSMRAFMARDQFRGPSDINLRTRQILQGDNTLTDNTSDNMRADLTYWGLLYHGSFRRNIFRVTGQYVSQTGSIRNTGITPMEGDKDNYTVDANMLYLNFTSTWRGDEGTRGRVGLSFVRSSGDGRDDNTLEGYTGIAAAPKFSQHLGSFHSILTEQQLMTMGTQLYSFFPEYHGSRGVEGEQGVTVGGLAAADRSGLFPTAGGRGDNPGLTLWNFNVANRFHKNWIYQTQYRSIFYNERFFPYLTSGYNGKRVNQLHMGNEWINEIYYVIDWNTMIQFAYTQLEPGSGLKRVAKALTGKANAQDAQYIAAEFVIRFQ